MRARHSEGGTLEHRILKKKRLLFRLGEQFGDYQGQWTLESIMGMTEGKLIKTKYGLSWTCLVYHSGPTLMTYLPGGLLPVTPVCANAPPYIRL